MSWRKAGIVTFAVAAAFDVATTLHCFSQGATEANPLVRPFVEALGPLVGMVTVKIGALLGVGIFHFRPLLRWLITPTLWVLALFQLIAGTINTHGGI